MSRAHIALVSFAALVILVVAREMKRRFFVRYEYRYDSFSVLGPMGRQLFQIRQSEIESISPARMSDNLGEVKRWPRSQFGRKLVIKARSIRRPIIISWEGKPIAGLLPEGFKPSSRKSAKRR